MKMKRPILLLLFAAMFLPSVAKTWQLTNKDLQVTFDDTTGLFCVYDVRNGKKWMQNPSAEPVEVKKVRQEKNSLEISLKAGFSFTAHVSLREDSGLEFVISASKGTPLKEFSYPESFHTVDKDYYLLSTDGEGMLLPVDDQEYPLGGGITYTYNYGGGLSMAWMGMTDKQFRSGYMTILETPFDAALRTKRQADGLITFAPVWLSSLEEFGYDRKVTYHFFNEGGYVAQCKKYREYIWPKNQVKTLKENLKRFPTIDNMVGAPHIYVWDTGRDLDFAKELKKSGIDKALLIWNANHTPYPMVGYDDELRKLGYGSGGYELFSDLHKRDTVYYEHDWNGPLRYRHTSYPGLFNKLAARKKDGSTYSNRFGTYACPANMAPQILNRTGREMKEYRHDTYFVDVYLANGLYECYNKQHPVTREGYAKAIVSNLKLLEDTYGVYNGGEWGAEFGLAHTFYVHGMMTLQRTWWTSGINDKGTIYYAGDWKNNSRPTAMLGVRTAPDVYLKYSINEALRVPLYELVYHDAVVTSWRWEDSNHHNPELWWKKDLFNVLYGTAPLWNMDRSCWDDFKKTFILSYKNVCPWLQKVAYDELLSHTFITADGKIQLSTFASGNSVVVNFSDTDYDYEGKTVKRRSYLAFGNHK